MELMYRNLLFVVTLGSLVLACDDTHRKAGKHRKAGNHGDGTTTEYTDGTENNDDSAPSICAGADIILSRGSVEVITGTLSSSSDLRSSACEWGYINTSTPEQPYNAYTVCAEEDVYLEVYMAGADSGGGTVDDPVLYIYPDAPPSPGMECITSDNNGGEGQDASTEPVMLFEGRVFTIIANAYYGSDTGSYELIVSGR